MTVSQVERLAGSPLDRTQAWWSSGDDFMALHDLGMASRRASRLGRSLALPKLREAILWLYTSKSSGSFRRRWVVFRNGKVVEVINDFYVD